MVQNYELYFIINPNLESKEIDSQIADVEGVIKSLNATNIKTDKEGVKKLAYPIKHLQTGYYVSVLFDLDLEKASEVNKIEKKINLSDKIIRFLLSNITEELKFSSQQEIKEDSEFESHREFNRGKRKKTSYPDALGYKVFSYKDTDFLSQFTSPYAKIFGRKRTGNSAKAQRKIAKAIKRARHMALMPFTPKHFE